MSENRSGYLAAFLIFIVATYNVIVVAMVVSAGGGVSVTFGILATLKLLTIFGMAHLLLRPTEC